MNMEIYPIGVTRKMKKSMLNRIKHEKRTELNQKDNIVIDTTYLTENKKRERNEKMIIFKKTKERNLLV